MLFHSLEIPRVTRRQVDCVEIYLPKRLKHLSEIYAYLRRATQVRGGDQLALEGFSIYEVDGVFRGEGDTLWEERSLVIRILFVRPVGTPELNLQAKLLDLGRAISKIAATEEEIWICNYQQSVSIFRPIAVSDK
jgi:hypothetical protein